MAAIDSIDDLNQRGSILCEHPRVCANRIARNLVEDLIQRDFNKVKGSVLLQAGHFSLLFDAATRTLLPAVPEELKIIAPEWFEKVARAIGIFPYFSWHLGVAIAKCLDAAGFQCSMATVVNDWQLLKGIGNLEALKERKRFYADATFPLTSYKDEEQEGGPIKTVGFLSEHWLRRRLERRLKRIMKSNCDARLSWSGREPGRAGSLVLMAGDGEKTLLRNGMSDCAGELAELILMAKEQNYSALINIYPSGCAEPVALGASLAFDINPHLGPFDVVQLALPCSGEQTCTDLFAGSFRASLHTNGDEPMPLKLLDPTRT